MTSADSAASVTRSAIRRLVLARISAMTTPAGRWVARIRWMPSDRPRCAMSTSPVTKSGSSRDQRGELVDDDQQPRHRLAARGRAGAVDVVLDVLGPGGGQQVLAPAQLGAEGLQRALGEVAVEVGDHADGVRQVDAVLERRAALVVDEHEGHLVRPVGDRERGDQGLQQLGLAGAGGAGDQAVRPVARAGRRRTGRRRTRRSAARWCGRRPAQRAAMPAGVGGSQVEHVEQPQLARAARGSSSSPADVADRGQRAGDAGRTRRRLTWSARIAVDPVADAPAQRQRDRSPGSQPATTARHSSGSSRSSASRQMAWTPTAGPSCSTIEHAGQRAQPPGAVEHDQR